MKGSYVRTYKKAPTQVRSVQSDSWHCSELAFPTGFASQSGQSPRGSGVRFDGLQRHQDILWLHWHSLPVR